MNFAFLSTITRLPPLWEQRTPPLPSTITRLLPLRQQRTPPPSVNNRPSPSPYDSKGLPPFRQQSPVSLPYGSKRPPLPSTITCLPPLRQQRKRKKKNCPCKRNGQACSITCHSGRRCTSIDITISNIGCKDGHLNVMIAFTQDYLLARRELLLTFFTTQALPITVTSSGKVDQTTVGYSQ